jgi:hypothetical protein
MLVAALFSFPADFSPPGANNDDMDWVRVSVSCDRSPDPCSGSILASLDTFKKMWISKREYEEDSRVLNRKTFL